MKKPDSFEDRAHTALQQQTTLSPAHKIVIVEMRQMLLLPLNHLLAITRGVSIRVFHAPGFRDACDGMRLATSTF